MIIIGAGPAGATAAALLAGLERSVILVDRARGRGAGERIVWVSAQVVPLLERIGVQAETACSRPLTELSFYNADLSKTARPSFEEPPGYVVRRQVFDDALVEAAVAAGAELRAPWPVTLIDPGEEHVEVTADGGASLCGRIALVAMGRGSELTAGITKSRQVPAPRQWTVQVDATLDAPATTGDSVSVVLGLDRQGAFGLVMASESNVAVSVGGPGAGDRAVELLVRFCQRLAEHEILTRDLSAEAARARLVPNPAGAALEMDSHVAKHMLIIGDAGGFVSAASQEGIYPAMWSAQLAVEV
ncbi:MAG: NAD(P)/FAD-dependent oxidoreductase, partial [Planctomycetota bacterium]